MRIVHLTASSALGGAERVFLDLLRSTPPGEIEPHLIVPTAGPLIERAEEAGASVTVLQMPAALLRLGAASLARGDGSVVATASRIESVAVATPAAIRYVAALRATIERLRPTIVHSHGIKQHLLASLACRGRVPVVWQLHDFLGERRAILPLFRVVPAPAAVIAISHAVAADARERVPGLAPIVVHNGIDTVALHPRTSRRADSTPTSTVGDSSPRADSTPTSTVGDSSDPSWLDRLVALPPTLSETLRVGLVATFARWKGQDVFIDAIAQLVRAGAHHGVRFYIVGGPLYDTQGSQFSEAELRELARSRGVDACVGFVPYQLDPRPVYDALDVVVHASTRTEPFGLTIAEAMACGRPVILTQSAGAAELITEGRDALVIPPGDPSALAGALIELLGDANRRDVMGRLARQRAVERFSRDRMSRGTRDAYLTALERFAVHRTNPSRSFSRAVGFS